MMKQKLLTLIVLLGLVIPVTTARAQEAPTGYNPFVPANLDDPLKLPEVPVVESSYHYYSVRGDANYTNPSTFVWYVENGTLGIYDPGTDTWTPASGTAPISNGTYLELAGETLNAVANSSGIWVKWNDGSGGSTGYIAVYERSADNCVFDNQITGYKHNILVPPEVWFLVATREECADQTYAVTAQLNEIHENSFPYTFTYTYPGIDGQMVQTDTTIVAADLDANNQLHWDLFGVNDLDVADDEVYVITIDELRDQFGSLGKIAPLGAPNQHASISITILHLPQTGGMTMD
jgi:hypothetical protein